MSFTITDVANAITLTSNPIDEKMMKAGEEQLNAYIQANIGMFTINLIEILKGEQIYPTLVRMTAAIYFKNFVKKHWDLVPYGEFQQGVKANVVGLALGAAGVTEAVARQVREVINLILGVEHIDAWPEYLPAVVAAIEGSVRGGDYAGLLRALKLLCVVTKRYETDFHTNEMNKDIYITVHAVQKLLLELLRGLKQQCVSTVGALPVVLPSLLRVVKIFYSISCYDLAEYFERKLSEWTADMLELLAIRSPNGSADDDDDGDARPGLLARLQRVICEIATIHAERYDEEFAAYVPGFLDAIWLLLCSLKAGPRDDALAVSGMRYLAAVAGSTNKAHLTTPAVLQSVCANVIVPSMQCRADDEELFEDDARGYIRRDAEGSNACTRRRAAHDLVVALLHAHSTEVTRIIAGNVKALLAAAGSDPNGWRAKDAAIALLTSVAVKASLAAQGVTEVNELVPIADFFRAQVLPEFDLAQQNPAASNPIVRADCIKFATFFRRVLAATPADARSLLALFIRSLADPSLVVRTYAATGVERLLAMRDPPASATLRYGRDFLLAPEASASGCGVQALIVALFDCLSSSSSSSSSDGDLGEENEYVMKAILRVLAVLREAAAPFSADLFAKLLESLRAVAKNPRNPAYNHYLFEAIACLARSLIAAQPAAHPVVEQLVLPVLSEILAADVVDFFPYVFQLYALLIDAAPAGALVTGPAAATYKALLQKLLLPALWDRSGVISAQSRLIQAYVRSAPEAIAAAGSLEPLLGLCQHLVGSLATTPDAYSILVALMASLPAETMAPYMPNVLRMCFLALQKHGKTPRAHRPFVVFMCKMFLVYGFEPVARWADAVQQGVLAGLFTSEFVPYLPGITRSKDKAFALAALVVLCCLSPAMLAQPQPYAQPWAKLVNTAFTVIGSSLDTQKVLDEAVASAGGDGADIDALDNVSGVGTTYAQLSSTASYAEKFDDALFEKNKMPKSFAEIKKTFLFGIHTVSQQNPGKLSSLIQAELSQDNAKILQSIFVEAGVPAPYIY